MPVRYTFVLPFSIPNAAHKPREGLQNVLARYRQDCMIIPFGDINEASKSRFLRFSLIKLSAVCTTRHELRRTNVPSVTTCF